jgi:phospholipase/carboxylesterase
MKITRYNLAGLPCVEVAPELDRPDLPIVIGLHGWGDWGETYTWLAPWISDSEYRFVFPTARRRVFGALFSWFDLEYKGFFMANLAPQVTRARSLVNNLIDELRGRYKLPADQVAVGGFSVGGMLSLDVGLRYPEKLGGIFSLSGFLVADNDFPTNPYDLETYYNNDRGDLDKVIDEAAQKRLPMLVSHGMFDYMIPTQASRVYYRKLRKAGVPVEFYEFWGGHQITWDELIRLDTFLKHIFKMSPVPAGVR